MSTINTSELSHNEQERQTKSEKKLNEHLKKVKQIKENLTKPFPLPLLAKPVWPPCFRSLFLSPSSHCRHLLLTVGNLLPPSRPTRQRHCRHWARRCPCCHRSFCPPSLYFCSVLGPVLLPFCRSQPLLLIAVELPTTIAITSSLHLAHKVLEYHCWRYKSHTHW